MHVSEEFKTSYQRQDSYPCEIVYKDLYPPILPSYRSQLENASADLFVTNEADVEVPFRDLLPSGQAFVKRNIHGDERLRVWLGDTAGVDATTGQAIGSIATKKDPTCRFIYLGAEHGRTSLKITRDMLRRIFSYHQVSPHYLDFLLVFGKSSKPRDLRYSGFREQTLLGTTAPPGLSMLELGRSGRQYQICYNLKGVCCTSSAGTLVRDKQWSIRQTALCHQFDVVHGTTVWIITKPRADQPGDLKERIEDLTDSIGRAEDRTFTTPTQSCISSLAVHLLLAYWCSEGWRWYIQWLEEVVDDDTQMAVQGHRAPSVARHHYVPEELQAVQRYQDMVNEAVMILQANVKVLVTLRTYYQQLLRRPDFPLDDNQLASAVQRFATQIDDVVSTLDVHISRGQLLVQITADRKDLIVQHLHAQAAEKMERLNTSMQAISVMSQREAIAMRIITVVTLLYLPATFVSTFFSTDVVKFQNPNGPSANASSSSPYDSFSSLALQRWLAVTLPLTAITLLGALLWYWRDWRIKRDFLKLPLYTNDVKA